MNEDKKRIHKLMQGAGFSVVNLLVGVCLGLVLTPYMTKTLGDRFYGILIFAGSFTGWYGLLDLGISSAVGRFITLHFAKKETDEVNLVANTAYWLYCILGFIGFLISTLIAVIAFFFYPDMVDVDLLSIVLIFSGIGFFLNMPLGVFSGVVAGTLRQDLTGMRTVVFRILGALVTFGVLYCGGRLIALSIGNLVLTLLNTWVLYRLAKKAFPEFRLNMSLFRLERLRQLFSYSIFTFINTIGDKLITSASSMIIAAFLSFGALTYYNVIAVTLVSYFQSVMLAATGWLGSWFTFLNYKGERESLLKAMYFGLKFNSYLASFIAFGLIAWGPSFIVRWMGEPYLEAYPCLVALTICYWVGQCQSVIVRYLYAVAKHHYFAYMQITEGVINLGLSIILVQYYGIFGVALGAAIPGIIGKGLVLPIVGSRILEVPLLTYVSLFLKNCVVVACALVLPSVATWFLVGDSYPRLFLVGAVSAILYFPTVLFIGFTAEERAKVLNLFKSK